MKLNRALRILIGIALSLLIIAGIGVVGVSMAFSKKTEQVFAHPKLSLTLPTDEASLAEGERWVSISGCQHCHGVDMAGKVVMDPDSAPLGAFVGPNITSGGVTKGWTKEDWLRTLRYGVHKDGTGLLLMPSYDYAQLSEQELSRMIAYLQKVPPSETVMPKSEPSILGKMIVLAGDLPFEAAKINRLPVYPAAPDTTDAVAHGKYLSVMCSGCHLEKFEGRNNPEPGGPVIPAIHGNSAVIKGGFAAFEKALREGKGSDGHSLQARYMPYYTFTYTNQELKHLYAFLKAAKPKETQK